MSFETFAVAVVILLFMAVVAVVCISLGYAGKKRSKESCRKDELAQELQRCFEREIELRSGEVKERVKQELQNRVSRKVKERSAEVERRVEQELQSRVDREIERRSGEVGERVKQELQNRVSHKVKERSAEVERRVEQELQNRVSRKVKERSAEVEKKGDQELQSRVDREAQRRSGEVEERVEQELQNRSSREFEESLEQLKEALKAISVRADLSSQQQSEASNTSEDSDVVEFDPHAPLKQKGTRNGVPYFNRTLTDDEAREYASRGDFYRVCCQSVLGHAPSMLCIVAFSPNGAGDKYR